MQDPAMEQAIAASLRLHNPKLLNSQVQRTMTASLELQAALDESYETSPLSVHHHYRESSDDSVSSVSINDSGTHETFMPNIVLNESIKQCFDTTLTCIENIKQALEHAKSNNDFDICKEIVSMLQIIRRKSIL